MKTEYYIYQKKYRNDSENYIDHKNYKEYQLIEIPESITPNKKNIHVISIVINNDIIKLFGTPEEIIKKLGNDWEMDSIKTVTLNI
jgi:hypothetical protein